MSTFKGINTVQTGSRILFRAFLTSLGSALATGTTNLNIFELQPDGDLKTYDFFDNAFKTGAVTTLNQAMTHRTGNNSTQNTGIWTFALTTVTGFIVDNIYFAEVSNTAADTPLQSWEFQYGGGEGDFVTTSTGTGTALVQSDLRDILGTALSETSGGNLAAAFKKLLDVALPVLTAASVNQTGDNYARIGAAGAGLTAVPIPAGAISFAQYAADLMLMIGRRPVFSGSTTPNITDAYVQSGWYPSGGATSEYYVSTTLVTPMYIWNDGTTYWNVTPTLGVLPSNYWRSTTLNGTYSGVGTTTGTPTVLVHGNATLTAFQPAQTWTSNVSSSGYLQADLPDAPNSTALTAIGTQVRTSIGMASANLDTQLAEIEADVDIMLGGTGANTVTITVQNIADSTAIQGATVTAWNGSVLLGTTTTNASGVTSPALALNNGTWTINVLAAGFSPSSASLVVSGVTPHTYQLTSLGITASSGSQTTGYLTIKTAAGGTAVYNARVDVEITGFASGGTGDGLSNPAATGRTDINGLVQFAGLPQSAGYRVRVWNGQTAGEWFTGTLGSGLTTAMVDPVGGVLYV